MTVDAMEPFLKATGSCKKNSTMVYVIVRDWAWFRNLCAIELAYWQRQLTYWQHQLTYWQRQLT